MSSNTWNDFQHEHAGEGLNSSDMSEMYHEQQDSGEVDIDTNQTSDTPETAADVGGGTLMQSPDVDSDAHQDVDSDAHPDVDSDTNADLNESDYQTSASILNSQDDGVSSSGNQWNEFEHQHAGEGKSSTELSTMYHAEQDTNEIDSKPPSNVDASDLNRDHDTNVANTTVQSNDESNGDASSNPQNNSTDQNKDTTNSSNAWNEFEHQHAGEGKSSTELSTMYHAEQDTNEVDSQPPSTVDVPASDTNHDSNVTSITLQPNNESNDDASSNPQNNSTDQNKDTTSSSNAWNEFEHQHAREGKNSTELSTMYHAEQTNSNYKNMQLRVQSRGQTIKQNSQNVYNEAQNIPRQHLKNRWNRSQHERKGQELSHDQMVHQYQQQQSKLNQDYSARPHSNRWNQFEHEHKGQGMSHQQMAHQYNQQQNEQQFNRTQNYQNRRYPNRWNLFEHEHKRQGENHQQMVHQYYKQQQELNSSQNHSRRPYPNRWNQFEHENRDQGWSRRQMTSYYQEQTKNVASSSKPERLIPWNTFQQWQKDKGMTKEAISREYHEFKENERTFRWNPKFQLQLTSDGKLSDPESPAGREAMKTGLFDEQFQLRRYGKIPFPVFQAKLFQMGADNRSKIASMYRNQTGTDNITTKDLRTSEYRNHAAIGTVRRDPDHILELQTVVSVLRAKFLDDDNYHKVRCMVNGKYNIESRGVKINRRGKADANRNLANNTPHLTMLSLEQEKVQADKANLLANKCEETGFLSAATVFREISDKYRQIYEIHSGLMAIGEKRTDPNEIQEQKADLIDRIRGFENRYGSLQFWGHNLTRDRQAVLNEARRPS
jgi:hypothetical protein